MHLISSIGYMSSTIKYFTYERYLNPNTCNRITYLQDIIYHHGNHSWDYCTGTLSLGHITATEVSLQKPSDYLIAFECIYLRTLFSHSTFIFASVENQWKNI